MIGLLKHYKTWTSQTTRRVTAARVCHSSITNEHGSSIQFTKVDMGERETINPHNVFINFVKKHCLGKTHRKGYDAWIGRTIYQNIYNRTVKMASGHTVSFDNLVVRSPTYVSNNHLYKLLPAFARRELLTYSCDLLVDMIITDKDGTVSFREKAIHIASIPVMLKSVKCNLHKLTDQELVACGEDPSDPGGYFIINGSDYVVTYLEKLDLNKFIMFDNKKEKNASDVTITTLNESRKTSIQTIYLCNVTNLVMVKIPSLSTLTATRFQSSVNIFHILKLLKFSDMDMFDTVVSHYFTSSDPHVVRKLLDKLCVSKARFASNPDSLKVLSAMLPNSATLSDEEKEAAVMTKIQEDIFAYLNYYFSNMPPLEATRKRNSNRVHLLAFCTAMLLERDAGLRSYSDRDSWSNKHIEASSKDMEYLLKNSWISNLTQLAKLTGTVDEQQVKKMTTLLTKPVVTESFITSFCTGKWAVKNKRTMKTDRAQFFVHDSPTYVMSMLDQVQVSMTRTDKQTSTRMVQESQYGFIDPLYCTEGKSTGLLKSIALTVQITPWDWGNDLVIIDHLLKRKLCVYSLKDLTGKLDYIFVNAVYVGWGEGEEVVEELRRLKLTGRIPRMTSISKRGRMISVHTTPFRLVRPLFVVDRETQKPLYEVLGLDTEDPDELLEKGAIEFLDPMEQECALVAANLTDLRKRARHERLKALRLEKMSSGVLTRKRRRLNTQGDDQTHLVESGEGGYRDLSDEDLSDGDSDERLSANEGEDSLDLTPLPYFFSVPEEGTTKYMPRRYTHLELDEFAYMSNTASLIPYPNHNQAPRNYYQISMGKQALGANMHRGANKELIFASDPLIKCSMHDVMGMRKRGCGQTMQMALMCRPNNSEDGVVVKREFLERGGLMMQVRYRYKTSFRDISEPSEVMQKMSESYRTIEENGLPRINETIHQGQCVIGKKVAQKDDSVKMLCGEDAVVHNVTVTAINRTTNVVIELRIVRNQMEGDKVSPRNAQKCTMSEVTREYFLPRVVSKGWSPDIYVNSHCLTGRVTISYELMIKAGAIAARIGQMVSGDPGRFKDVMEHMETHGTTDYIMRRGLYDALTNRVTSAPVYFQALKHHVLSKKMCRGYGKVHPVTRVPNRGRCWNGGLKFAEMESDAVLANGGCSIVRERLMDFADKYSGIFCKVCGHMTEFDSFGNINCVICNRSERKDLLKADVPYISQVIIHTLACCGLKMERVFDYKGEQDQRYLTYLKGSRNPRIKNYVQKYLDGTLEEEERELEIAMNMSAAEQQAASTSDRMVTKTGEGDAEDSDVDSDFREEDAELEEEEYDAEAEYDEMFDEEESSEDPYINTD